jgi:hypothetical protein
VLSSGLAPVASSKSATTGVSASILRIRPLSSGRNGNKRFTVRAGEEVGTEQSGKVEAGESSSSSSSSNNGSNGSTTSYSPSTPFPTGRKYTGYVEKDTAGQTNIYAVEPTVYVSDSVFSSGEAGSTSAEEASNSAGVAFVFGLVAIASVATILFTVGKGASGPNTVAYNGPPLSYYISKFSPAVEAENAIQAEAPVSVEDSVSAPALSEVTEAVAVDGA